MVSPLREGYRRLFGRLPVSNASSYYRDLASYFVAFWTSILDFASSKYPGFAGCATNYATEWTSTNWRPNHGSDTLCPTSIYDLGDKIVLDEKSLVFHRLNPWTCDHGSITATRRASENGGVRCRAGRCDLDNQG